MARSHVVTLSIGAEGVEVSSWDEVTITLDMLRPGSPWTVTLWRTGRGESWARVRELAKLFAPIEIRVDGALQLRGVIERIRDGADRGGAPFTISGRDTLAAAMVADVDPRLQLRDTTLAEAFERVLLPLGINVMVGALAEDVRSIQAGARPGARAPARRSRRAHRVDRFRPQVGQRAWDFMQQLARRHGYLIYSGPVESGTGLVIDRPAYDSAPQGALVRRQRPDGTYEGNILSGTLTLDATDIPTEVTTFGRTRMTAPQDARHSARTENVRLQFGGVGLFGAIDQALGTAPTVRLRSETEASYLARLQREAAATSSRSRTQRSTTTLLNERLTIHRIADVYFPRPRYVRDTKARTPQIAEQRARHVIARSMQEFAVYEAAVQGFSWGTEGRLWTINSMVTIDDEIAGVRGSWLCTSVTFSRSRSTGHTTRLRLVPPRSIDLEPDAEV